MDGIQILIFVVVALVYFIQWLARQGGNQNPQSRGPGGSTEEEKVRRFMEALGMPAQDQPPPPPQKVEATPPPPPAQRRLSPQPLQQPSASASRSAEPERDYYAIEEKPAMAEVDAWGDKIKAMQRKTQEAEKKFQAAQRNVSARGGSPGGLGKAVGDFSKDEPQQDAEEDAYAIMSQMKAGKASALRKLMQTTAGAQQAVVLREVLGPPKGLEY